MSFIFNTNFEELRFLDEFSYLSRKYKNIAFNIKDWNLNRNLPENGKKHLFVTEGPITIPENFEEKYISEYQTYIVNNSKIYDLYKNKYNCILIKHPLRYQNYFKLNNHIDYRDKINGIISIQNYYNPINPIKGTILELRNEFMSNNFLEKKFIMNSFGPNFYGGKSYNGAVSVSTPFHNLFLTSKYKFRFCPEPIYDEFWSHDYLSERMFVCFDAKTIPIYIGAYNVDNFVPSDFFIDLRKYIGNYEALYEELNSISEKKYREVTEEAFLWQSKNKIGSVEAAEEIFSSLEQH
jgi:hypothetical protein